MRYSCSEMPRLENDYECREDTHIPLKWSSFNEAGCRFTVKKMWRPMVEEAVEKAIDGSQIELTQCSIFANSYVNFLRLRTYALRGRVSVTTSQDPTRALSLPLSLIISIPSTSLSPSLSLCLPLTMSLSLPLSLIISLPSTSLSLYLSISLSLTISPSLALSLSLPLSLTSLSSTSLSPSLPLSLSPSLPLSLSPSPPLSLSPSQ